MNSQERSLLDSLDLLLRSPSIRASIDQVVERAAQKLAVAHEQIMAWETVPLSVYGRGLPGEIQSSWVFILRAGATTGAERHPNSRQTMMSYRGAGDLQTGGDKAWTSHRLVSDENADLERRWVAIPENTWHQAVVSDLDWIVVSFHTVPAEELIEERVDPEDRTKTTRRRYLAAGNQSVQPRRVDFSRLAWAEPSDGVRFKAAQQGDQQLRLLEFSPGFSEVQWCDGGHIGYMLAGQLEVQFNDRSEILAAGDALMITAGDPHRARVIQGPVRLFLVEPRPRTGAC